MLGWFWFDGCAIGKRTDFHQNARIGQFWSKRTKKWANTNAQNKTGFWSSRYIYNYAYSPHFPSIVLQHWSPSRFSRLSFFNFHVMWQVLAILWYIYITYIILLVFIICYVIYYKLSCICIYMYIAWSTQKIQKDGSRKWPPHCSPPRRGQAYLQQPGHIMV